MIIITSTFKFNIKLNKGLRRFDDQRPTSYIDNDTYLSHDYPKPKKQTTLLSSPRTSWANILPDKPFSGSNDWKDRSNDQQPMDSVQIGD